ncbi:MAG: hypothetical protein LBK53_07450 [Heliobacteriaceae bacterium]|jgi:poly(A) polymerase/tRNA nucleotidyltransferase (CCA-adding enzyme)|nr:hypothetical protein [Heliobacteriaceae bacterium]
MNIINLNDNSDKLYYVGGVVRDFLLGKESRDIDIVYEGNAVDYCRKFGEVIRENPEFGTIRVKIDGQEVDFASTRCETYPKPGHLPAAAKFGCSLKEDVLRRDFTVNALAMRVSDGEIIDYAGGRQDLENKKLRVLHDRSFIDDPARIIRGLKFSARFGFELEEHTKALQDEYLANVNRDMCYKRIKKELEEIFGSEGRMQNAFEKFINQNIYKLITPDEVKLPDVNIEKLTCDYPCPLSWIVYAGVLGDLSILGLTRAEKKILDDAAAAEKLNLKTDLEIYKAFENASVEAVLLYAARKDEKIARHYLDNLRGIKLEINGNDLKNLNIKPSAHYGEIFDFVLGKKLSNPALTKPDELELAKSQVFSGP